MKQVLLSRASSRQVVWIPAKFAVKGKYLRIVDQNGWKVEETYAASPFLSTSGQRGLHHLFGSIS